MKPFATSLLALSVALRVFASSGAESTNAAPNPVALTQLGVQTLQKLDHSPAAWTVICRLQQPEKTFLEIKVVRDGDLQTWVVWPSSNNHTQSVARIIQRDHVWYVQEQGRNLKCLPYEAPLHFPAAYLFLSFCTPKCVVDEKTVASATFDGRQGNELSYRMPLAAKSRSALEKVVADIETQARDNPAILENDASTRLLKRSREVLAQGVPLIVDEQNGIITHYEIVEIKVNIHDFRWLDRASIPNGVFAPATNIVWDDQSKPWPESDLTNCLMVAHDPSYEGNSPSKIADGYILNLRTGRLRRAPFHGSSGLPNCFLGDRREVLVTGMDGGEVVDLFKVNFQTGATEPLRISSSGENLTGVSALSPDGSKLAVLEPVIGNGILNHQVRIVDLLRKQSRPIGDPGRYAAPLAWTPDGDAVILERAEVDPGPLKIEHRILLRIGLDGKQTDLRPGTWPVVLYKSRKILYRDVFDLWRTCDLDGSHPELYADGLYGHFMAAVSPDETQIVFTRRDRGESPKLFLFDWGKSKGKPIEIYTTGLVTLPLWR